MRAHATLAPRHQRTDEELEERQVAAVGGEVQRCLALLILRALSPSPPRLHFAQSLKEMASMRARIGARGRIGWAASRQAGAGAIKVRGRQEQDARKTCCSRCHPCAPTWKSICVIGDEFWSKASWMPARTRKQVAQPRDSFREGKAYLRGRAR
jgi:hypothetical protein